MAPASRRIGFIVLLWVACALGFLFAESIRVPSGVPVLAAEGTATAIRIAAVVTFGLLGALGTRLVRSLARGWPLLAIGLVPAAIGVIVATWALSRLPPGVPVTTGDSVAWQMILEAACVPAMAGLGARVRAA